VLRELAETFRIEELVGIRNIPARTLTGLVRSDWRLDVALERTPLSGAVGFFWLARAVGRD
jgi:hypothetical protein